MKYLKMLGLAAVAATALMAFGAGTASATTLCKTNETPCTTEWKYHNGTTISASLEGTATLNAGFVTVTCTEGTVNGEITNEGSATTTVSGPVNSVTFGSCNCELVQVNAGGTLELHHIEGTMNGTLTSKAATSTVRCSGVTCHYTTAASGTDMGTLTGSLATSGTATMDIRTSLTKEEGSSFLCASGAEWVANYKVTSPDVLEVD